MMKRPLILITGAAGQVGQALVATSPPDIDIIALSRHQLNICNYSAVMDTVAQIKPNWIINAAAYTKVDHAENDSDLAFSVNGDAPGYLAEACLKVGAKLLHLSTDYIFDGQSSAPYKPTDIPNPINIYGQSKLIGEKNIQKIMAKDYTIIRTAWVYDFTHRNFLTTMLRMMREQNQVRVVVDQVGTPTSAYSLAQLLWIAICTGIEGIFHYTDAGVASWYDFAVAIELLGRKYKILEKEAAIKPIYSYEFKTLAKRPMFSVLDKSLTWNTLSIDPQHWVNSLEQVYKQQLNIQ